MESHGNGVYTLLVWGCSVADSVANPCEDDNSMVIVEESIFYGIDPPDTYSPDTAVSTPTPTATPASSPTPTAATYPNVCGDAVTDKPNTGLVADCNALLAARDTLRGTAALNWAPNTPHCQVERHHIGGNPREGNQSQASQKGAERPDIRGPGQAGQPGRAVAVHQRALRHHSFRDG